MTAVCMCVLFVVCYCAVVVMFSLPFLDTKDCYNASYTRLVSNFSFKESDSS